MLQMKLSWSKLGHLLEWLGAIYFIGFAIFGVVSLLVLIPRYQSGFIQTGQAGIFARLEEIIGPLVVLFLVISASAWYQGRELRGEEGLNWYDKLVAVCLLVVLIFILTPQLYLAITSLLPAVKG